MHLWSHVSKAHAFVCRHLNDRKWSGNYATLKIEYSENSHKIEVTKAAMHGRLPENDCKKNWCSWNCDPCRSMRYSPKDLIQKGERYVPCIHCMSHLWHVPVKHVITARSKCHFSWINFAHSVRHESRMEYATPWLGYEYIFKKETRAVVKHGFSRMAERPLLFALKNLSITQVFAVNSLSFSPSQQSGLKEKHHYCATNIT